MEGSKEQKQRNMEVAMLAGPEDKESAKFAGTVDDAMTGKRNTTMAATTTRTWDSEDEAMELHAEMLDITSG